MLVLRDDMAEAYDEQRNLKMLTEGVNSDETRTNMNKRVVVQANGNDSLGKGARNQGATPKKNAMTGPQGLCGWPKKWYLRKP